MSSVPCREREERGRNHEIYSPPRKMNQVTYHRLQQIGERLKRECHAEQVILFGSYARGEETVDSDIDILVIAPTQEHFFDRMATVLKTIRDLRKGLPVEPIVLTSDEVKKRVELGDSFIQGILQKGISLPA